MKHIDIDQIKSKVKKIKWNNANKKYLEDLIFIDPQDGEKYINWNDIEKKHLENLQIIPLDKRKDYILEHSDWNLLYKIMVDEYGLKCWYSEAPIGNGELEIDHFRPKNRARQENGKINKENGYWWLAYSLSNYRLSGKLANLRRRDRLKDNSETEGKGDLFPIDLEKSLIAEDEKSTFIEKPLLLDPFMANDVGLLSFDEDGTIFPNPICKDEFDIFRAKTSIELYHLDLDQLEKQRQEVWVECSNVIENAYTYYFEGETNEAKKLALKICAETINKKLNPKSPFTAVAKTCLNVYRYRDGYKDIIGILNL